MWNIGLVMDFSHYLQVLQGHQWTVKVAFHQNQVDLHYFFVTKAGWICITDKSYSCMALDP